MSNDPARVTGTIRRLRMCVLTACAVAAACVLLRGAEPRPRPRLLVLIVVDQMKAEYVERFMPHWSSGFRRLVTGGAWFTDAAYPYLATLTCPGHATVATGTLPAEHGIFQNAWYDRSRRELVACTHDPMVQPVRYSPDPGAERHGPGALRTPTLGDEMRVHGARVVSLALKARSAIMLAGHGGKAVTWLAESLDAWETSTAFAPRPVPEVAAFVDANPISADYGKVWTPLLPARAYSGDDDDAAEAPPQGWGRTFPHALTGLDEAPTPGRAYAVQWERSPYADAYVGRMAAALAASLHLGRSQPAPDLLAIGFSSTDLVGHTFGPRSHEVQDMYYRLDGTLGALLASLDALVGPDGYTVALTSDHGVTDTPAHLTRDGRSGGRLNARATQDAVQRALESVFGAGVYAERGNAHDVYLRQGVYERLVATPGALETVRAALARVPGVARVFTRDELSSATVEGDAERRAARLSYVPARSGDLVVTPQPGWIFTVEAASHGSAQPEDQRVPIVFYGAGIRPGRYSRAVSPADVAPTLASIAGVRLPRAGGRVLTEALR